MSGRREEAQREIEILKARSESGYVSPISFAAIYSGLGDEEQALPYLERAVEIRDTSLHLQLLSTEFDTFRNITRDFRICAAALACRRPILLHGASASGPNQRSYRGDIWPN